MIRDMQQETKPGAGRPYCTLVATPGQSILDIAPDTIERLYKAHGALLLRGFALDLAAVGAFAGRLCSASVTNDGGTKRQLLDRAANIQTVAGGAGAFPLHPELSREPWKPDVAMFACFDPPSNGGETIVCDGVALARALPPPIRAAYAGRRLLYRYPATPAVLAYWLGTETPSDAQLADPPAWCPFTFARTADGITRAFSRPALHQPMFASELAFGNYLLFARYKHKRSDVPLLDDGQRVPALWVEAARMIGDRLSAPIAWQRGDLLLLDNTRFMHGRAAITDLAERRIVSYFGYLRWARPDPEEPADPPWRRPGFVAP
jgi:hypothetical protein